MNFITCPNCEEEIFVDDDETEIICPNCGETVWSGRIESKIITEDGYDPIFTPSYPNENEINLNPIKIICKKSM